MLVMGETVEHQELALRTVGLESHFPVQGYGSFVPRVHAKLHHPDADLMSGVPQSSGHERTTDALPAVFWCHIHAPDECLVHELVAHLALHTDQPHEATACKLPEDSAVRLRSEPLGDDAQIGVDFFCMAGAEGLRAFQKSAKAQ